MNESLLKFAAISLLFLGEAIAIYVELKSARTNSRHRNRFFSTFIRYFLIALIAGSFSVAGTMLGFKGFANIWIVAVIALTADLIVEPVLDYAMFKQLPTRGALIGFVLGSIGFVAATFF